MFTFVCGGERTNASETSLNWVTAKYHTLDIIIVLTGMFCLLPTRRGILEEVFYYWGRQVVVQFPDSLTCLTLTLIIAGPLVKSRIRQSCCDKNKRFKCINKKHQVQQTDVLPNQVHYNIAVNKRIKLLLEEIYKWQMDRFTTFERHYVWIQTSTVYQNKLTQRVKKIWRQTSPFKNRHFIKIKISNIEDWIVETAGQRILIVHK